VKKIRDFAHDPTDKIDTIGNSIRKIMSIPFDQTIVKRIENVAFGDLGPDVLKNIFGDGRIFSHFIERVLAQDYGLTHVTGCKGHDIVDPSNPEIKYEQKTFTQNGCKFMPSNMIGQGRQFDKTVFHEKARALNYIIVSNVAFPELKIRFVKGVDLISRYPNGVISMKQHDIFFGSV
jgi:hypothetical protein